VGKSWQPLPPTTNCKEMPTKRSEEMPTILPTQKSVGIFRNAHEKISGHFGSKSVGKAGNAHGFSADRTECFRYEMGFLDRKKGGHRSTLYLKKVASLPLNNGTATWQEIKNIQSVRNAIVHNDGRLKDKDTIEYCRKRDLLPRGAEVTIKADYLPHVIETFDNYFKEIHKLISPNTSDKTPSCRLSDGEGRP
jgi:hypothetical protein